MFNLSQLSLPSTFLSLPSSLSLVSFCSLSIESEREDNERHIQRPEEGGDRRERTELDKRKRERERERKRERARESESVESRCGKLFYLVFGEISRSFISIRRLPTVSSLSLLFEA